MTTTLRPARPVRHEPDGSRSGTYTVCVNSRPVGAVMIGTDRRFKAATGRIDALAIDAQDRRRGRGTVAALAAEEVLRGWGCTRVETTVGADMPYALRMAAALGYTERNTTMVLAMPDPPVPDRHQLPPGTSLRQLREDEYDAWRAHERDGFVRTLVEYGVPPDQAEVNERVGFDQAFPRGLASPGTSVLVLEHEGEVVGHLAWLRLADPSWVSSVEVVPAHRGRGHGRTLMCVAENLTRDGGAGALGLDVFAANTPALRLYASLGFRPTAHHFAKTLI